MIISGGHAIKYWASLILDLRKHSIGQGEIISKEEGIKVGVTVKKNHCIPSRNPYVKVEYYAVFGEGIEQILSSISEAIEKGILDQRGSWLYWMKNGEEAMKWNSKSSFRTYMKENPDVWEEFYASITGDESKIVNLTGEELDQIQQEKEAIDKAVSETEEMEKKGATRKKKKPAA